MAINTPLPSFTVFLRETRQPVDRTIKAMKDKYIIGCQEAPHSNTSTNSGLKKVMAKSLHGTVTYWHYALAENAENCHFDKPYVWKVTRVAHSTKQKHPILIVEPVIPLDAKLLRNARFGALIARSNLFPMNKLDYSVFSWNYNNLAIFLEEPITTDADRLCETAVLLALKRQKTFEELIATLTPCK